MSKFCFPACIPFSSATDIESVTDVCINMALDTLMLSRVKAVTLSILHITVLIHDTEGCVYRYESCFVDCWCSCCWGSLMLRVLTLTLILRNSNLVAYHGKPWMDDGADKISSLKGILYPLNGVSTLFMLFWTDQSCMLFTPEHRNLHFSLVSWGLKLETVVLEQPADVAESSIEI